MRFSIMITQPCELLWALLHVLPGRFGMIRIDADVLDIVWFAVIQWTYQQDSFYFDPAPIGLDVIEGEDVHLRCDVSNRRDVVFYWTLNGKTIANTSRRFQDDSDLRIVSVDRNLDSGSLRCVATNFTTGIALRSTEAKLNISCKF